MRTVMRALFAGLLVAAVVGDGERAQAQFSGGPRDDRVSLTLSWPDGSPAAGTTATLGVVIDIASGWHVQAGEGSGDEQPPYIPTTVGLELPTGWTSGKARWPEAHTFTLSAGQYTETLRGYEGRIVVRVPVEIPAGAPPGPHDVAALVGYQACDEHVCEMPTSVRTTAAALLGEPATAPPPARPPGRPAVAPAFGASGASASRLGVELVWYETPLVAGDEAALGVEMTVVPGWHVQAGTGSGDEVEGFIPTVIDLTLPEGWTAGAVRWPEAHEFRFEVGAETLLVAGYQGRVLAVIPITVPLRAEPGSYTVGARVGYQACDDRVCEMPTDLTRVSSTDLVAAGYAGLLTRVDAATATLFETRLGTSPPPDAAPGTAASTGAGALAVLLLAAFVGGFLLNLTPCVLPIIPLKIMGLAQSAANRARMFALGMAMSIGVVAFWMGLGITIVTVSGFTSANQLFQYPTFSISIGAVIAVLAVGMCGLFSMRLPSFVYTMKLSHDSYLGSFLFGIMTAILSTPCTAPFMGGAMVAAVGQSAVVVLAVFAAIGAGMAIPYAVLSAWPKLVERMPRTGPASVLIKQVMGLAMLAAAAFFVGIGISGITATPPAPASRVYWWPVCALTAAAAGWLAWRSIRIGGRAAISGVFAAIGVAGVAASFYGGVHLSRPAHLGPIAWTYYTPQRFADALDDGKVVLLEFTAEWCLNCKLLEKGVLNSDAVAGRLAKRDVVPIKVDLTGNNTVGNAMLEESGSVSIPWLVIYTPGGEPVFAQNFYTATMLLDGIERARDGPVAVRSRQEPLSE